MRSLLLSAANSTIGQAIQLKAIQSGTATSDRDADPGWQAPEKAAEAFRASPNLAIPASSKGDCIIKLRGSWLVIPSFGGFASWLAKGEDVGGDHVKLRPMLVVSEFEFPLSTDTVEKLCFRR